MKTKKLKIRFEQMFLLVRHQQAPVVLFPTGAGTEWPHELYVFGTSNPLLIAGADLSIVRHTGGEGERETLLSTQVTESTWPHPGWILDLNKLADPPKLNQPDPRQVKHTLYSRTSAPTCPSVLGARFYMPHGEYGWAWNHSRYGEARWLVGPESAGSHNQWLTDIMTFECDVPKDNILELRADVAGQEPQFFSFLAESDEDVEIVVHNRDISRDEAPSRVKFLDDFRLIYDLAVDLGKADCPEYFTILPTTRPAPGARNRPLDGLECVGERCLKVMQFSKTLSSNPELPICGGGSGDPEPEP